jgi:hypothetical protein
MLLGVALCATFFMEAQKVYFIYLQTDDATPFFIKMNNQVYSSNYSGYLILSNLKDSTYSFTVGPVPAGIGEPRFTVPLNGMDRGYLIKNFKDYIGLFDLQKLSVLKPDEVATKTTGQINPVRRTDAFSVMLALSAGDSSLLYSQAVSRISGEKNQVAEVKKIEVKDSLTLAVAKPPAPASTPNTADSIRDADLTLKTGEGKQLGETNNVDSSAMVGKDNIVKTVEKPEQAQETPSYKKSVIIRKTESSTSEGFGLVFIDQKDEQSDTIRLLIPNPRMAYTAGQLKQEETSVKKADSVQTTAIMPAEKHISIEKKEEKAVSQPATEPAGSAANVTSALDTTMATVKIKVAEKPVGNISCKAQASDNDFFKVRKNMASKDADEDMIAEARKMFKSRCFTTEQVRNLSALFLTPSGKYQFFDAAFAHVSDLQNFASLQNEIKDDYNLKRFKALIGE